MGTGFLGSAGSDSSGSAVGDSKLSVGGIDAVADAVTVFVTVALGASPDAPQPVVRASMETANVAFRIIPHLHELAKYGEIEQDAQMSP
ncbi:hypothetical protein GCM10022415_29070 [Knoellia locipacati]|uniref:Uncharacterized protein n=1 Tax=Knoellia locipacati TaxID=882824 RepID=A0A512T4J3_9MICO|nr:hypothetical protein KLO01_31930 [Knoellia locipacati]